MSALKNKKKLIAKIGSQNFNVAKQAKNNTRTKKACTVLEIATTHSQREDVKFYTLNCWGATAEEALLLTPGSRITLSNVSLYEQSYRGKAKGIINVNSSLEIDAQFIK